jgi:Fe-S-cluster containining protein
LAERTQIQPPREAIPPGACLCDFCPGKCCRYFTVEISTPRNWDDFDETRWYLAHGDTLVYVEDGTWNLVVMSRCRYLSPENRCGIYHDRPKICREYTTDECEYDDDWIFQKVFEVPEQLWEYASAILPPRPPSPPPKPPKRLPGPPKSAGFVALSTLAAPAIPAPAAEFVPPFEVAKRRRKPKA